jgi:hypothetical protein
MKQLINVYLRNDWFVYLIPLHTVGKDVTPVLELAQMQVSQPPTEKAEH